MSFDLDRLYELLPAVYRLRDIELAARLPESLTAAENAELQELQSLFASGSPLTEPQFKRLEELQDKRRRGPLKALLAVIAEQVAVLEEDLARAYDDLFIETCAEWVVPYIGDLIGARGLFVFPNAQFSQRALVADEIALRRRKGTAAALEQLARDVTGWDASVVEYFQLLATTQYMNHLRPENLSFADLSRSRRLDYLNTPFDPTPRNADVRNIESRRGRYNIPNVGVFLWRLGSYSITAAPAYKLDDRRYLFDALGKDVQLYNHPEVEDEITHLAEPVNVPMPLSRRVLDRYLETYYGRDKSLLIYRDGQETPIGDVHVCDLSDVTDDMGAVTGWAHMPQEKIAIDPALGRIAFPSASPPASPPQAPPQSVRVTYHYGFSADMGGGEYEREIRRSGVEKVFKVPSVEGPTLQAALNAIVAALTNNTQLDGGVVEIEKPVSAAASDYHNLSGVVNVPAGKRITIRAVDEHRPVVLLGGDLEIKGGADAELELNGLLISGGALRLPASGNQLQTLRLAHCSLPPGAAVSSPPGGGAPSVVAQAPNLHIEIDRSIVGAIRATETSRVCLTNSIVDAGDEDDVAYAGIDAAGAPLVAVNSTIIGRVHTLTMELASNTIFFAGSANDTPARAEMLQEGCVRFCYAPPGSRLPRQFECQPETQEDAARVRPIFTSLRYGDAGYCQLSVHCSEKIKSGADDGAEIGAFHDLYQPQRVANLRARLDENLRFSLEAGIFMAS
jgi:Phage tail protein (Tail_P2_I)